MRAWTELISVAFANGMSGWFLGHAHYWPALATSCLGAAIVASLHRDHRRELEAAQRWRDLRWNEWQGLKARYVAEAHERFMTEIRAAKDSGDEIPGLDEHETLIHAAERRADHEIAERFGPIV